VITDGVATPGFGARVPSNPDPGEVVIPEGTSASEITDGSFTGLRDAQLAQIATVTNAHKTLLARKRLM
jgi:hypothetical protein